MSYRKFPPDPPSRRAFWAIVIVGALVVILSYVIRAI